MTRYQFFRVASESAGSRYLASCSYGATAVGSYQLPLMVALPGKTATIAVTFNEVGGGALPDPVPTVSFELWRRDDGAVGTAANQVQLAKTANLPSIRGTTASEPVFYRLRWQNIGSGADEPQNLRETDAISVRIVTSDSLNYRCIVAVEVAP